MTSWKPPISVIPGHLETSTLAHLARLPSVGGIGSSVHYKFHNKETLSPRDAFFGVSTNYNHKAFTKKQTDLSYRETIKYLDMVLNLWIIAADPARLANSNLGQATSHLSRRRMSERCVSATVAVREDVAKLHDLQVTVSPTTSLINIPVVAQPLPNSGLSHATGSSYYMTPSPPTHSILPIQAVLTKRCPEEESAGHRTRTDANVYQRIDQLSR
ncbi:unnamed protein product [Timema podura]|uniref:Uncharacterized protein n=1 Tax=Timema podura TaxID=61482 RepID=A0ABN7NKY6_TIMPD|nr:unnamed protein product [Timema podura]